MKAASRFRFLGLALIILVCIPRAISIFYGNLANLAIMKTALSRGGEHVPGVVEPVMVILKKAESWWPSNPTIPEAYGRMYSLAANNQKAIPWFLKSQQRQPENIITKLELGNAYNKNGDYEAAIRLWRSIGAGSYFLGKGRSTDLQGDYSLASQWYTLAVKINPELGKDVWYWDKGNPLLLANSDLEKFCSKVGLPCNWLPRDKGLDTVVPDTGYLSGSSVKICSQMSGGYLYQRVNTLPLTTYKLSGWIKTLDLPAGANLIAWKYRSNEEFIEPAVSSLIQGDAPWTEVSVNFNTGSEPEYVAIVLALNGPGCSWFDNVELVKVDSVP
jgi:tetratricopeptide (TPR) repeat protein